MAIPKETMTKEEAEELNRLIKENWIKVIKGSGKDTENIIQRILVKKRP